MEQLQMDPDDKEVAVDEEDEESLLFIHKSCSELCDGFFAAMKEVLTSKYPPVFKKYIEYVKERPFGCDKCTSRFKRKQDLKQHHNDKHSPPEFKCQFCPKAFSRKERVRKHCDRIHKKKYTCKIGGCEEVFQNKADLSRHLETPHKCIPCGRNDVSGPWHRCRSPSLSPISRPSRNSTWEASNWDSIDSSISHLFSISYYPSSAAEVDDDTATFPSFASSGSPVDDHSLSDISESSLGSLTSSSGCGDCQSTVTYGTISQNDFSDPSPCTAIAATALAFTRTFGPDSIKSSTAIDSIVRAGVTLSRCCRLRYLATNDHNPNLSANEVSGRLICDAPLLNVLMKLNETAMTSGVALQGIFTAREFNSSLNAFWKSINFQFAIFTLNYESVAFIKNGDCLYIFDSHKRQNGTRPAQVTKFERHDFDSERELVKECDYVYDYLKNNLLRIELPSHLDSLPLADAQKYFYSIEVFDIIPFVVNA